ncbi:MAG: undecaprenyl-phosphate glucose phosphotransferase [Chloroflexi bacterium]|nr:undecaprenyl-phosphate glucose phosphotransferase [Chloroflexota bacterium]
MAYSRWEIAICHLQSAIRYLPFSFSHAQTSRKFISVAGVFFFYKLYHFGRGLSRLDELYKIFTAVSISVIVGIAFTAFVYRNDIDYPRVMIAYFWIAAILLLGAGRLGHHILRARLYARGWSESRLLIVGAGEAGNQILERIRGAASLGFKTIGFLDDKLAGETVQGLPVLGKVEQLGTVVQEFAIDEVIIALPEATHQELLAIISLCEYGQVSIKIFPDVFQIMASEVNIGELSGLPLLTMRDVALRGWRLSLKRIMDLIVSAIVLIVLSPFLIAVAVWVKLDSSGPAIFAQTRMGLDANPFPIFKFRSMIADAEMDTGPVWATKDDPRRTRLGSFLRRHSIDEFPQFINVFLGHMSLVGPRPERPIFVEQFRRTIPRYMERHHLKAGLTSWAIVNGLRGDTSIHERTKYDLWYIENWSVWLDLKIILLTALKVIRDPNAV